MAERGKVLILGGTGQARALAQTLAGSEGVEVVTALAGRTAAPLRPAGGLRVGGFGGPEGLAAALRAEAFDLLIDATHPYAARMSHHAVAAAAETGRPLLRLQRPAWSERDGDQWITVPDAAAAAAAVAARGRRVFLTTGAKDLTAYAGLARVWFLLRLVDRPTVPPPLAAYRLLLARGPFSEAAEADLLRREAIDLVVSKNAGGPATYGKIAAARVLGLPVVMLARPPLPPCQEVEDVAAAVAWVAERLRPSAG